MQSVTVSTPMTMTESHLFTYKARQYASRLKISSKALRQCATLDDLKTLAKRRYRILAKRHHPDTSGRGQYQVWSQEFNAIHNAYRWFQQLEALPVKTIRETIPEYPLPWSMERRPLFFGPGWHEVRS